MRLSLGAVVTDTDGLTWVFIGIRAKGKSKLACFHVAMQDAKETDFGAWLYSRAKWSTLVSKFPALSTYVPLLEIKP